MQRSKNLILAGLSIAAIGIMPLTLYALDVRVGETVTHTTETPAQNNAYLVGSKVLVHAPLAADGIALGGTVEVTGPIADAFYAMGGTVTVANAIGEDARIIAGDVSISGAISGEALIMGGLVKVASSSVIGRGAYIVGDRVEIAGTITGPVTVRARSVEISGTINGTLVAYVDYGFTVTDRARINGQATYHAGSEGVISKGATLQTPITFVQSHTPGTVSDFRFVREMLAGMFLTLQFMSILATALLITWLFPHFATRTARYAIYNGGKSIGAGIIATVGGFFIALLMVASIVLILPGIAFFAFGIAYLFVAKCLAGVLAGALIAQWWKGVPNITVGFTLLGTIAITIIGFVPIIGPIAGILLFFATAGSLAIAMRELWWKRRSLPVPSSNK